MFEIIETELDMISYDYLYKNDYYKIKDSSFCDKELSYKEYDNAYVIPGKSSIIQECFCGVVDEKMNCIQESQLHNELSNIKKIKNICDYKYSNETVIFLGSWLDVWGHWLTDNIRRMWFLKNLTYKLKFSQCKLVYVCNSEFSFSNNVKQLFECLNIDPSKLIKINEVTKFSRVVIPDGCFFSDSNGDRFYTKEYLELIESIKNSELVNGSMDIPSKDKIYFTYRKFASRKTIGEYSLESFFKKQGYEIICPEKLDFIIQVVYLRKCKCFASTIGSCSHNVIFTDENTEIILIPRANYLTGYQVAINDIIKSRSNIHYIDSCLSIFANKERPWIGPFFFYQSGNLLSYFGVSKIAKINKLEFYLYEILAKSRYAFSNEDIVNNYFFDELKKNNMNYFHKIRPNIVVNKMAKFFAELYNFLKIY